MPQYGRQTTSSRPGLESGLRSCQLKLILCQRQKDEMYGKLRETRFKYGKTLQEKEIIAKEIEELKKKLEPEKKEAGLKKVSGVI